MCFSLLTQKRNADFKLIGFVDTQLSVNVFAVCGNGIFRAVSFFGKLPGTAAIRQGLQNLPFRWRQHTSPRFYEVKEERRADGAGKEKGDLPGRHRLRKQHELS